ncbi:MAG: rhamnulokinase [Planctomycetaceae bacterium]|nr:rhamnulokinase [Planctomycetaceae bacterium]
MADESYLAVDLGASSGRVLAGHFDGQRLRFDEISRFGNGPVRVGRSRYWDVLAQWSAILAGLREARQRIPRGVRSLGVDTWGVDFGLLGRGDELLGNPYHYRDSRTDGIIEKAFERVSQEEIFAETGLQFMPFNTLFQLLAMRLTDSPLLDAAESLLLMPDLFHWMLTGVKANELTNATTTQFFNPATRDWSRTLLTRFDLPTRLLGPLIEPGTDLGPLLPVVIEETGLRGVRAVAAGTHDTASAVVAVPTESPVSASPDWCYISSGTWSLMGVELPGPLVTPECLARNYTNEGGVGGTTRLLKNIAGLWLVQECRRVWDLAGKPHTWDDLNRKAAAARPLAALVDPNDPGLLAPADMPEAIRDYCRRTGQGVLEGEGAVIRCALESLALKYREVLESLEALVGCRIKTIHIVGGGVQNRFLCQATADASNRVVIAGPVEATAMGNLLVQAQSAGRLQTVAEIREVVRRSTALERYEPREAARWDEAYEKFRQLAGGSRA